MLVVETIGSVAGAPSLYVSAGIHGDEPAGVEGLIQWAEDSLPLLTGWNFSFFPCLNPWGLERNIRTDAEGRDLNRCYHSRKVPQIAAQLAAMNTELVIFGSGERLRFPNPAWIKPLVEKQIGIETMDTQAACRTYNILAGEGRHVAVALLIATSS